MISSRTLKIGATSAMALLLLNGCKKGTAIEPEATAQASTKNPLEITADPALLKQLKIGQVTLTEVASTLRVPGRVEADETRMAQVGAPITGRITELEVIEGQTVTKGQPLAGLYSTELSGAQFALIRAQSQSQLAQRAVERAKQLLAADVIGSAELQRREAEYLQATAEVSSARDQLRVLGMSEEAINKLQTTRQVNSLTQVVSSIDGTVLDRKATIGQIVQPATTIFTVADLSNVWLVADIPEQNAGMVTVGTTVEAEIPAFPGQKFRGRLTFVSSIVDPDTRTVRVRMDLLNPKGRLKPAMLATMMLKDTAQRERIVPMGALVREEDRDCVYVQTASDTFVMRQVILGAEFDDQRVLLEGVAPGEKIVLDGAFHLNNERKRRALQKD